MSRVVALITAGGSGTRMGTAVKKQYIELRNKPVLAHTVHRFEITEEVEEIILTAPAEDMEFVRKNIAEKYNFSKLRLIVPGGSSRQESVFSALDSLDLSENSIVLIHDAVRPFVDHSIIQ